MGFLGSGNFWLGIAVGVVACAVVHRYALPMPTTVNGG